MSKKRRIDASTGKPQRGGNKRKHLPPAAPPPVSRKKKTTRPPQPAQAPKPPFGPTDTVLLVGEGDFSFALSLRRAHGVRRIVATSFDSAEELVGKYPLAAENLTSLLAPPTEEKEKEEEEEEEDEFNSDGEERGKKGESYFMVHHSIDATSLLKRRIFSKSSRRYTRIVFQFPHVGGVTKDQARQVSHNQTLLLGFFKSALPLLAPHGCVVVTLFDGLPYELWNIRALSKQAGFVCRTSLVFDAAQYPGYAHVRTLGHIEGGGAWKGEDRKARMYLFESATPVEEPWSVATRKRKLVKGEDSDDD